MSVISWPVQAPLTLLSRGAFSKVWDQRLLISPVLSHPDPELPAAFRAALSGPENTSSDLTAKLDSPGAPGVLASAFAFGGSNAVLFFTARQELDQ